ncbi:unnamed protein product [Cuscuta europaea]|uniref:Uncharacterized protein n=1 Tax=Cuscuta europaea TaxID=41803 RepID=A0A9P0YZ57_CUSEU|nr:unnamed protein product [Cuscuta europaea]
MGCLVSQLASKFAFFPPSPATYQVKKRGDGHLVAVSTASSIPIAGDADDPSIDVLRLQTKRGNKIVAFYLKNPYARLTLLYSHGNAADLGQLYDLFLQLKANLRVNLMGYVFPWPSFLSSDRNKREKIKSFSFFIPYWASVCLLAVFRNGLCAAIHLFPCLIVWSKFIYSLLIW